MRELIILCYHGVVESFPSNYNSSGKHILVSDFEKQMAYLSQKFEIVRMVDIEQFACGLGDLPQKSFAITFDDGFSNNLEIAHPILAKYQLPATLYVSTSFISSSKLIWTDELERLILESPISTLKIAPAPSIFIDFSSDNSKRSSYLKAKQTLKTLSPRRRAKIISSISDSLPRLDPQIKYPSLHDFLTWDQVRFMKASGVWDIGAHTVSHNSLGTISKTAGRKEIWESISEVKSKVSLSSQPLFSFPEGQSFDMPTYSVDFLRKVGLHTVPSAIPGRNILPNLNILDNYRLKRFLVGFNNLDFPWDYE